MTIDTLVQNRLKELREGKEINWDYVATAVKDGRIGREEALRSLKSCLEIVIPKYERTGTISRGYSSYYRKKLEEAREAIKAIDEGRPIKYRTKIEV